MGYSVNSSAYADAIMALRVDFAVSVKVRFKFRWKLFHSRRVDKGCIRIDVKDKLSDEMIFFEYS